MKNYKITVNGNQYDVTVEEMGNGVSTPVAAQPVSVPTAPVKTPVAAETKAPAKATAVGESEGSIKLVAPMPGKILALKASVGQAVKRGEPVVILEAMKMENEIVASEDGTIASINVNEGNSVEAGDLLATLK